MKMPKKQFYFNFSQNSGKELNADLVYLWCFLFFFFFFFGLYFFNQNNTLEAEVITLF